MRFKFCGGLDAPDWLLKEIALLSQLTSIRFKLIWIVVSKYLLGEPMDYAKVDRYLSIMDVSDSDTKAIISAIEFMIVNGVKYDCDTEVLKDELQQLGLPREHCISLGRTYAKYKDQLTEMLSSSVLSLPKMDKFEWRLDYILGTNVIPAAGTVEATFKLDVTDPGRPQA